MKLYLAPLEGITGYVYRHIQIKSYQHIDKPHWRRIDRKGYRDQSDRLQRLYKRGRRVRFPREKVRHQFRAASYPLDEPGRQIKQNRPDQKWKQHTWNAFLKKAEASCLTGNKRNPVIIKKAAHWHAAWSHKQNPRN